MKSICLAFIFYFAIHFVSAQNRNGDFIIRSELKDSCSSNNSLALLYYKNGNTFLDYKLFDKALYFYRESIKYDSLFNQPYLSISIVYSQLGMLDSAEYFCVKALKIIPTNDACSNLASVYCMQNKFNLAIKLYHKLIENKFDLIFSNFALGQAYFGNNEFDKAIKFGEASLALCKSENRTMIGKNMLLIGSSYLLKKNIPNARIYLKKAMENDIRVPDSYKVKVGL